MKRAFATSLSVALTLGFAAPAFASDMSSNLLSLSPRSTQVSTRPTSRSIGTAAENRNILQEMRQNTRAETSVSTKQTNLYRTRTERELRHNNRVPKVGSDRYRVLNHPNTRSLRKLNEQSALPPTIVQTGGQEVYDRPTRRDVQMNAAIASKLRLQAHMVAQ